MAIKLQKNRRRAFTLVELMVVVGIIALMSSIILASISMARENTREKKRVSDIANIESALLLYREKERDYPQYDDGIELGVGADGGSIDAIIESYNGNTYADPSNENGVHEYWYDSNFTCFGTNQTVLYVSTMEQSKNANYDEVCTHANPDTTNGAGSGSYIRVLGF